MGRKISLAAPARSRPFCYEFPRPAVTVDCVIFGWNAGDLAILLIRRGSPPFAGTWALPGGFVEMDETLEAAARRELAEEAGIRAGDLAQLETFGDPGRDPRGRTVTIAFFGVVDVTALAPVAGSDAGDVAWFPAADPPPLAFDHARILAVARDRLARDVSTAPLAFDLLPPVFTLSQLQAVYERILGRRLDKRNFRKKLACLDVLGEATRRQGSATHRSARLYRFDRERQARSGATFRGMI